MNFVAVFFIFQIDLGLVPLIPSEIDSDLAKKINGLVSSFSQGLIISSLFYFVVVFIPAIFRRKTAMKIILSRLKSIASSLQQSIGYFCYKYDLPASGNTFKGLKREDFEGITGLDNELRNFKYKLTTGNNSSTNHTGTVRGLDGFVKERDWVISKIDEILSLPIIEHADDELIETLTTLRDSWFYAVVHSNHKHGLGATAYKFNDGVYTYYDCYQKLNNFITPHGFEIIRD